MRIATLFGAAVVAALVAAPAGAKDADLAKAIAGKHRSENFVARDAARKPQQVLEFIGIKPNMTVLEINPGGGYWTEILGPYLKDKGTYYTTVSPASAGERAVQAANSWKSRLEANKEVYGNVKTAEFGRGVTDIVPEGSVDMVLTFRNLHNWMGAGFADEALATFYKALKPGGVLGITDHRAREDLPLDERARSGYVRESYAIELAEKVGFKFVGKSDALYNPKDTRDHAGGVWTLPPTLRLGEQDREKYLAIGEADNFLLKFEKPKK